jgi:AmiR/NasT family two-component response regulator
LRSPDGIQPTSTSSTSRCRSSDGLEAADELAAAGLRRPVVIVTGIEEPELINRAIASGVAAYLTKPIGKRHRIWLNPAKA